MTLFKTLLRSVYAVDGADGEFLADLTRPIPYAKASAERKQGMLAMFPSTLVRDYRERIQWHETAIEELLDDVMDDSYGDWVEVTYDNVDEPSDNVEHMELLRTDLAELQESLAAL